MELVELDLRQIVARGEDSRHQFKEDIRNVDSLAAEIVAFSNSQGGHILIGVSNQGALLGLSPSDVDRINQLISNTANQHVRGPVAVQTENIVVGPSRVVIILTVPEGIDKPYFDHQGVIWLKSGADKRRVNSKEELRRLFQEVDLVVLNKNSCGNFCVKAAEIADRKFMRIALIRKNLRSLTVDDLSELSR